MATWFTAAPAAAAPGDDALRDRARAAPGGSSSTPNSASKKTGALEGASPRALALMAIQEKLDRVADRIEAAAKELPQSGVGGLTVDADHNAIRLYWHGTTQPAVVREVDSARRAKVAVDIVSAPYTRAQLQREADRLATTHMASKYSVGVSSIAAKPDGTGLIVGIAGLQSGVTVDDADTIRAAGVQANVTSIVPLEFKSAAPQVADRWYDTPQYYGGSLALQYTSSTAQPDDFWSSCTTGFGVTGLNGAAEYIMFANHCGEGQWRTGWYEFDDGSTLQKTFGSTIVTRDVIHDTQLILTPEGAGARVYTGESFLGSGQPSLSIKGSSSNHTGDYICTSGSWSGTVCDIRVTGTGITINVTDYGQMRGMVEANHIYYQDAAGNGDSGGPVISTTTGGALARGTISAMDSGTYVDCFGVPGVGPDEDGRHCAWKIYYPDIALQLAGVGVRLNTE